METTEEKMCDMFITGCAICGAPLPIHLGDYETGRNEIEVFCLNHLPSHNVTVFTTTEDELDDNLPIKKFAQLYPEGFCMGIRYLTVNAIENKEKNVPNIASDWEVEER